MQRLAADLRVDGFGLVLDGREVGRLSPGDSVACTQGPRPARIMTLHPRDFHQVLKAKFGLADR